MTEAGSVTWEGPATLVANQLFRAVVKIRLAMSVAVDGRLVLASRHMSDLGDPQDRDPQSENFIRVESKTGVAFKLMPANDLQRHPWNRGIDLKLTAGSLMPGDEVVIHLGPEGSRGYRAQSFVEEEFGFRLGVDASGKGDWAVATQPAIVSRIIGNAATALRVMVTQVNATRHRVCLKPEDAYGNVAAIGPAAIDLWLDEHRFLQRVEMPTGEALELEIELPGDGRHRLSATSEDAALTARSNPFGESLAAGLKLYWGEIHSQSGLCDGTNSPAYLYDYARKAAGLDFAAVTSHDFELTQGDWEEIRRASRKAHVPGEFVSFLGYEWSGDSGRGGDHNVYFLDDDGPLIYNGRVFTNPAWDPAEGHATEMIDMPETIRRLRGQKFMVIPHGGGRTCNLDFFDGQVMPLLEVHSCHRSYDHLAFAAIERGLRVGFIGGSDDHRGAIGDSHPTARDRFFSAHNGLVAVYAEELTRESLWQAFQQRRTYATNGARMAVDVRMNDTMMGGELRVPPGAAFTLQMQLWLDGLLDRIEVFRGTTIIRVLTGGGNQHPTYTSAIELQAEPGEQAYWLRVFQTDGGKAWTSPIWVRGEAHPIVSPLRQEDNA